MKEVAVSIHAKDNFNPHIIKGLKNYDYIHVDVMDGKFVDSSNINLDSFRILKEFYSIPIIGHLMVIDVYEYIEKIVNYVDYFVFHLENNENKIKIIEKVKWNNKRVGIALNPDTSISGIIPYLDKIDLVMIMAVYPGWSGQKFIDQSVGRVNALAKYKEKYNFKIDIDGGVTTEIAGKLCNADILTSASTILTAKHPNEVIQLLKNSDNNESKKPAIFLDRDGVINKEVNYLSNPNDFEFIDGSIKALQILKKKGFLLIVITNQAGIARGYFTEVTLHKIHDKMIRSLIKKKIFLDDLFYCPHHPEFTGACNCRKPSPGMIIQAMKKYNIDLENSYMIGDTLNDINTGKNAGCKTVLVLTGHGKKEQKKISEIKPDMICTNLLEFAKNI